MRWSTHVTLVVAGTASMAAVVLLCSVLCAHLVTEIEGVSFACDGDSFTRETCKEKSVIFDPYGPDVTLMIQGKTRSSSRSTYGLLLETPSLYPHCTIAGPPAWCQSSTLLPDGDIVLHECSVPGHIVRRTADSMIKEGLNSIDCHEIFNPGRLATMIMYFPIYAGVGIVAGHITPLPALPLLFMTIVLTLGTGVIFGACFPDFK
jgi:hypothetical protein